MKIVHFASCTGHGGDVTAIMRWATGQAGLGHSVRVLASWTQHTKMFVERCHEAGLDAEELIEVPLLDPAPAATHAWRLWRRLAREKPDVVHMHTGEAAMRAADVWAAQALGGRSLKVVTTHGGKWFGEEHAARWKRTSARIDGIISPSEFARQFQLTAGVPEEKVRVVHNAIDMAAIDAGNRDAVRKELGLAPDQELILFFARLDPVKRPLDAIEAFATIAEEYKGAVLAMAGIGTLEEKCRRRAKERGVESRVRFLGYRTDAADCLHAADIFILPTEWENFSLSLLEAMAASLPIVTTPAGGNLEALTHGETAWIAETGNIEGFAMGMRHFLAHPEARAKFGRRAREHVASTFTAEAAARKLIGIYEDLGGMKTHTGK
ncbi:MAG TPA: glycosyltransferase family 4 protein [Capsulimonadaceae bacterium]|nr:glycosyltransferase family 4 protein [Capsulimonadaceae bacterium]